jgi:predicted nucleic acid-binding protein
MPIRCWTGSVRRSSDLRLDLFFLRYLAQAVTGRDHINERRAAALFALVDSGAVEITTSEAILAEVAFILTSPQHYAASRSTVAAGPKALLRPRGCRMPTKEVSLRALDIWVAHPELRLPDALGAAYSSVRGHGVATFDFAFAYTWRH